MSPGHLLKECQLIALFSVRSEVSRAVYDGHFPAPRQEWQEFPYGLAKRPCVPPAQGFGGLHLHLPSALWPEMGNRKIPKTG